MMPTMLPEPMAPNTQFINEENSDWLCRYVVKHTISCHIYWFKKMQHTNNDVRATQDISKSASKVDFVKWLGFQVTWSEDRKRSSDLEENFKWLGNRKRVLTTGQVDTWELPKHRIRFRWLSIGHICTVLLRTCAGFVTHSLQGSPPCNIKGPL